MKRYKVLFKRSLINETRYLEAINIIHLLHRLNVEFDIPCSCISLIELL